MAGHSSRLRRWSKGVNMATIVSENERVGNPLTVSREPVGPKRSGDKGTMGDRALMDAVLIVGVAWAVLFVLAFSLHRHNV